MRATKTWRALCSALALWALAGAVALAQTVTLKPHASGRVGAPITLGDVASIGGERPEYALGYAGIVLSADAGSAADAAGVARVEVARVREALRAAGANLGRLEIRGSVCEVRVEGAGPAPKARAERPRAEAARLEREPEAVDLSGPATVRREVAAMLVRLFAVDPADLRVAFDDEDGALLATATEGRRVDVQPGGTASSGRLPVRVWVFDGDRVAASGVVTARALVRREAVTLRMGVARGAAITAEAVSVEPMWMSPSAGGDPVPLDRALSSVARGRLPAGTALRPEHLEPALLVRKGDLVTVHCVSGGLVVRAQARAMADGREGEMVEMRLDKARRSFLARVSGKGRAVMVVQAEGGAASASAEER